MKYKSIICIKLIIGVLSLGALIACGSSDGKEGSPYTELFEPTPGATATPGVLTGLWESEDVNVERRLEISDDSLILAARCSFSNGIVLFAGIDVDIQIDPTKITILEAKQDKQVEQGYSCNASATTGVVRYTLDNLNLNAFGLTFVKSRD